MFGIELNYDFAFFLFLPQLLIVLNLLFSSFSLTSKIVMVVMVDWRLSQAIIALWRKERHKYLKRKTLRTMNSRSTVFMANFLMLLHINLA